MFGRMILIYRTKAGDQNGLYDQRIKENLLYGTVA